MTLRERPPLPPKAADLTDTQLLSEAARILANVAAGRGADYSRAVAAEIERRMLQTETTKGHPRWTAANP